MPTFPGMTELPDAERASYGFLRWIEWARGGQSASICGDRGPLRLAGHVVLVAATTVAFRTSIAWMLEEHGATTIVIDSVREARAMVGYFDLDAIVIGMEVEDSPLCELPRGARAADAHIPLAIALADPGVLGPVVGDVFDAVVPFDARERAALVACMSGATRRAVTDRHAR